MANARGKFPIWVILVALFGCFSFRYAAQAWEFHVPEPASEWLAAAVCAVLLLRHYIRLRNACLERGLIRKPIQCRYDCLAWVAAAAVPAIRFHSDSTVVNAGQSMLRWDFQWGNGAYALAVIVLVLVLRIREFGQLLAAGDAPVRSASPAAER